MIESNFDGILYENFTNKELEVAFGATYNKTNGRRRYNDRLQEFPQSWPFSWTKVQVTLKKSFSTTLFCQKALKS